MKPGIFRWTRYRRVGADAPHLVVLLDGIDGLTEQTEKAITEKLFKTEEVDVVAVRYEQPFTPKRVIYALSNAIKGYRRVTFIGDPHLGARLGHDVIDQIPCTPRMSLPEFGLIIVDSSVYTVDLQSAKTWQARLLPLNGRSSRLSQIRYIVTHDGPNWHTLNGVRMSFIKMQGVLRDGADIPWKTAYRDELPMIPMPASERASPSYWAKVILRAMKELRA